MKVPRHEEGAALLTVLLLVAVMTILSVASLEKLKLATKLSTNGAAIDQARAYAMAAETVALYRIGDLIQRDGARTTLQGNWARRETNFPIDGGIATARLDDGGNCFNLNSTVIDDGQGGYSTRNQGIAQFERLMLLVDVPPAEASRIASATADWIDTDTIPLPNGAEDPAYRGYRTANSLMADPSELRVVAGVGAAAYSRVRPYLCALPVTDLSPININTLAAEQAILLAMLVPGLNPARAQAVIEARPQTGYENATRFWDQPALGGAPAEAKAQVSLKSRWFDLRVRIELAGAEFEEQVLLDAAVKPARLVRRSYGAPQ
ncbi:MAG: type II secretion system minor pseudopilin GspK [Sphingomonadaceae bacterium]